MNVDDTFRPRLTIQQQGLAEILLKAEFNFQHESQRTYAVYCSWDNAVAESFFSSLKKEITKKSIYKTREMYCADVFDYIECFTNPGAIHISMVCSPSK